MSSSVWANAALSPPNAGQFCEFIHRGSILSDQQSCQWLIHDPQGIQSFFLKALSTSLVMKKGTMAVRPMAMQRRSPGTTRARPRETATRAARTASSGVTTKAGIDSTWDSVVSTPGRRATE